MTATVPTGNTYDKYGSSNPVERRLMTQFLAALDRTLPGAAPPTILEVGVGEGEIAARLAGRYPDAAIVGVDLLDDDLAAQWSRRGLRATFGDVAALPFPTGTFDLVVAIEVLEHVRDPDMALREISRVARADVVVSVPREPVWRIANMARGKYWSALGNTPGHVQHWGKPAFATFVAHHLDVVAVHSPLPWTMVGARVRPTAPHAA